MAKQSDEDEGKTARKIIKKAILRFSRSSLVLSLSESWRAHDKRVINEDKNANNFL
jgi:hypothetical protein